MPTNSTIPDLANASALTDAFSLPAADGLGNDVEVPLPLFKTYLGTALRSFFVPAAAIRPSVSGGCAALALIATSANQPDISSLDFDATTAEYAQFWVQMPKNWNEGTVQAAFVWSHASTTTNFGVKWGCQAVAISDGDAIAAAYGTAQEIADTGGATNTVYVSAKTPAITIAGSPQPEDWVAFRVYRLPSDSLDTLAVDARLMGVKVYYSTNTTDEA
jgi:hypothetical protein